MGINRFYNPSLPEYTSQFVEDKTPWESIIGFEQDKIQRAEKTDAAAGEIDALSRSVVGGLSSEGLAQEVKDRYKQRIQSWQQKHGDSTYSVPAMRELTRINADFHGDPDVQLVMKDYQDSELHKKMILQSKPGMINPNVDPNTGQYRQYKSGDQYSPYDPLLDLRGYFTDIYKNIPAQVDTKDLEGYQMPFIDKNTGKPVVDSEGNPVNVNYTQQETIQSRNEEMMRPATEKAVADIISSQGPEARYFAKLAGKHVSELTPEDIMPYTKPYQKENVIYERDVKTTPIGQSSGRASGTKKEPEKESNKIFSTPMQKIVPLQNTPGGGELKSLSNIGFWKSNRIGKVDKFYESELGQKYYKKVTENPDLMFSGENLRDEEGKVLTDYSLGFKSPENRWKPTMQKMIFDDPWGTRPYIESYFDSKIASLPDKNSKEAKDLKSKKDEVMTWIDEELKDQKVNEKIQQTDVEKNKLLYAYNATRNLPGELYQSVKIDDINNLTPQQKYTLQRINKAYDSQINEVGVRPDIEVWSMPGDPNYTKNMMEEWTTAFTGIVPDANGEIKLNTEASAQFSGQRVVDLNNPDKPEMDADEKNSLFKKGKTFKVTGKLKDETSQYGPGMYQISTSDGLYLIEGDKREVEKNRLSYNINTFNLPQAKGESNFFAVRGPLNTQDGIIFETIDRFNNIDNKKGSRPTDVWMNVAEDFLGTTDDSEVIFRVYQADPNNIKDASYANLYDEKKNPNGYIVYPAQVDPTSRAIDPVMAELQAYNIWIDVNEKRGTIKKPTAAAHRENHRNAVLFYINNR